MEGSQLRWALVVKEPPAERRAALSTRDSSMGARRAELPPPGRQVASQAAEPSEPAISLCVAHTETEAVSEFRAERCVLPFLLKEFDCGW